VVFAFRPFPSTIELALVTDIDQVLRAIKASPVHCLNLLYDTKLLQASFEDLMQKQVSKFEYQEMLLLEKEEELRVYDDKLRYAEDREVQTDLTGHDFSAAVKARLGDKDKRVTPSIKYMDSPMIQEGSVAVGGDDQHILQGGHWKASFGTVSVDYQNNPQYY